LRRLVDAIGAASHFFTAVLPAFERREVSWILPPLFLLILEGAVVPGEVL